VKLEAPALAAAPRVAHGFFTRRGGVSEGVWASLNVGWRSGDEAWRVRENRARCAQALGAGVAALVTGYQVHGTTCRVVDEPWAPEAAPEADALVTTRPGIMLGVVTADCAPVLLADPGAAVIAAVHAGWRGALDGVLEATVAAMRGHGAAPERLRAVIGPCIAQASYEVGPEFRDRFMAADAGSAALFAAVAGSDRWRFDLPAFVAGRLRAAGVAQVTALGIDTCADGERFFSFRRTTLRREPRFGLQLSGIMLRP
jgi:YfiH family protein